MKRKYAAIRVDSTPVAFVRRKRANSGGLVERELCCHRNWRVGIDVSVLVHFVGKMTWRFKRTTCVPGDVILVRLSSKVGVGPRGQTGSAVGGTLAGQWSSGAGNRRCHESTEIITLHRDDSSGCNAQYMGEYFARCVWCVFSYERPSWAGVHNSDS